MRWGGLTSGTSCVMLATMNTINFTHNVAAFTTKKPWSPCPRCHKAAQASYEAEREKLRKAWADNIPCKDYEEMLSAVNRSEATRLARESSQSYRDKVTRSLTDDGMTVRYQGECDVCGYRANFVFEVTIDGLVARDE